MKFVPREKLVLESEHAPSTVLAAIPRAVQEWNRRATVFGGFRCELDGDRVQVGWWPRLAVPRVLNGGVTFAGHVQADGSRTVIAGEVRLFPHWREAFLGGLLLLAAAIPVAHGIRDGDYWMGALGAAWLFGGTRLGVGIIFGAYRKRIAQILRAAAGMGEDSRSGRAPGTGSELLGRGTTSARDV